MTSQYKTAMIDDVISSNITDAAQQSNLLDLFEYIMKSISVTLIREAKFNTNDFATAKQRGCEGFELCITRIDCCHLLNHHKIWRGEFSKDEQKLIVIGSLG